MLLLILGILALLFISWGVTVGVIFLICLCFNLQFTIVTATGIWLFLGLISGFLKSSK